VIQRNSGQRSGSILADVLLAVLERGIVVGFRLVGPPGDRRLLVGLGTAESFDPVLLALGITGHLGGRSGWYGDPYEDDPYDEEPYEYQPYE
jgi:hypothetical protein